jgi:hypothetical protein
VRVGNQAMALKHAAPRSLVAGDGMSALVLHALRYLGEGGIDGAVIRKLRAVLSDRDKAKLARDTRYAADWITEAVKRIVREEAPAGERAG